jgi:serralysin
VKAVWTTEQVMGQLTKWGGKWDNSVPVPFMFYSQSLAHHDWKTGFAAFSEAERQSLLQTMQLVADVANISFVNIPAAAAAPSKTNPFMGFYTIYQASAPFRGAAGRYITEGNWPSESMGRMYGADIIINRYRSDMQGGWAIGDSNSRVLMHELLHGLGFNHTGDYNGDTSTGYEENALFYQDSNQYTVMSYWAASSTGANHYAGGVLQHASSPLLYDVAALQKLYGTNMSTRTGDTVYGFNNTSGRDAFDLARDPAAVFTIWDAGGTDTLDLSGYSSASRVDLREGEFSDAGGMTLNISIAATASTTGWRAAPAPTA